MNIRLSGKWVLILPVSIYFLRTSRGLSVDHSHDHNVMWYTPLPMIYECYYRGGLGVCVCESVPTACK